MFDRILQSTGKTIYTQTIATFGSTSAEEYMTNILVSENTFNLSGEVRNAIGIQILSDDSSININNNHIYGHFDTDKSFICFALTKCGNSNIYENTAEITGGNNISFISYDKGGIAHIDNNLFTITDCISWLMIQ